ncbi:hypothetical protein D5085_13740 [Ectothiorhodospiraceae bacterium BW-2]|nr:hypothetical protein D5085_13740 [Ectothiorhodospiraceae bacterium BW-2]
MRLPLLISALLCGWLGYFMAQMWDTRQLEGKLNPQQQLSELKQQLRRLERQNRSLQQQQQIDQAAAEQSAVELRQQQQQLKALQQELGFYRTVTGAVSRGEGIALHRVELASLGGGWYRFLALFNRRPNDGKAVSGQWRLELLDSEGRVGERLSAEFEFDYFGTLDMRFKLAEDFTPQQLALTVAPSGEAEPEQFLFYWAELVNGEEGRVE